jgi:hypothetical protein
MIIIIYKPREMSSVHCDQSKCIYCLQPLCKLHKHKLCTTCEICHKCDNICTCPDCGECDTMCDCAYCSDCGECRDLCDVENCDCNCEDYN